MTMGNAKQRGSYEDRVEQAIKRNAENVVLITAQIAELGKLEKESEEEKKAMATQIIKQYWRSVNYKGNLSAAS